MWCKKIILYDISLLLKLNSFKMLPNLKRNNIYFSWKSYNLHICSSLHVPQISNGSSSITFDIYPHMYLNVWKIYYCLLLQVFKSWCSGFDEKIKRIISRRSLFLLKWDGQVKHHKKSCQIFFFHFVQLYINDIFFSFSGSFEKCDSFKVYPRIVFQL